MGTGRDAGKATGPRPTPDAARADSLHGSCTPGPYVEGMNAPLHPSESLSPPVGRASQWVVEYALLGAVTATCTPLAGQVWVPLDLRRYALVAGALAALSGALLGLGLRAAAERVPGRSRAALALVVGWVPIGAWGALSAGLAAVWTQPDYWPLALPCGAVAGMVQGLWYVPTSVAIGRAGLPRWPLALLAAAPAPVLATCGVLGVLGALDAVGLGF